MSSSVSPETPKPSWLPHQTVVQIMEQASDVFINQQGIIQMAWDVITYLDNAFQNEEYENVTSKFTRYSDDLYPDGKDSRAPDWIFVLHTLNFSLWSPKGTDPWTVNGFTGFSALCAAMKRAINEGLPMWNPRYYKELFLKPKIAAIIFRSDNETHIPILQERLDILHEVGEILLEKYDGTFLKCINVSNNDVDLLKLIINNFPSYQENIQYDGKIVNLYLKASTLLADLICFFRGHNMVRIIDTLQSSAMLVDFRVIQLFLKYKALHFTDRLKKKIEENNILEFGSTENLGIIACTYLIRSYLYMRLKELIGTYKTKNPDKQKLLQETPIYKYEIVIDNFLWDYRHAHDHCLMKDVLLHIATSKYL